jgi:DNA-binding response OmpR family regulator
MMPKLDGYEVCRRLKADSRSAPIPILMITALVDRSDRIRGIDAGADDFVLKPFDREELLLRVRNAVCRKRLYDELQRKYQELRNMAELREGLTRMIDADNEVLSSLLRQRMPSEERAPVGLPGEATGRPPGGDDHGAH